MKKLFLLCLIALDGTASAGLFEPAIVNPSFEDVEDGGTPGSWGYVIDDWYENENPYTKNFYEKGADIGLAGDGLLWAGTETGGLYYQVIGTYDANESYIITLLIGARGGTSFNTGSISLYAGGTEDDAADAVDLSTITDVVLLDTVEITVADGGTAISEYVYEVTVELSTGTGATTGDTLWLEFGSVAGKDYFDNISIIPACFPEATLTAPVDGETLLPVTPTFEWDEPCTFDAETYNLEYTADPNFTDPGAVIETVVGVTSPYTGITLVNGQTYKWRIESIGASETSVSAVSSFTIKPPDAPPVVDAGDNVLTTLELAGSLATGGSVVDDGTSTLTINGWTAFEALGGGLTTKVTFTDATVPDTTAIVSEAGTYILKLTATDANGSVSDQKEITVYASACDAAKATGEWTANYYDRDDDCDVDMTDFAIFAAEWLNSTALDEGWIYEGDFGDPANALISDYWTDVEGEDPNDLLEAEGYPDTPAGSYFVTDELRGTLTGNYFGQRIHGYIVAPLTGDYTFYISSDDGSRLFLSSDTTPVDTNPALGNQIAEVIGWTNPDAWETDPSQASTIISLTAGQYYYIEVLHKENTGGDGVSVGWKLPGEATIEVIPGTALRTELP